MKIKFGFGPGIQSSKSSADNNITFHVYFCIEHRCFDLVLSLRENVFHILFMMYVLCGCKALVPLPGLSQEKKIEMLRVQRVGCWKRGLYLKILL